MTSGQISYDLRRLRAHGIITRIPHSRTYQVTPTGIAHALFITHLAQRFLTQIIDPDPPADSRLRSASRAYQAAIDALARDAHLAA
ncbi:hypothetical protein [Nonomuraea basaltis]|uniref:hypothetical protein n=1 Tax=Nonomuraea basaltis TaxID=2495887 RepID=UPI001F110F59|nr:hypothetical protein [Nonomuraea basaltis]